MKTEILIVEDNPYDEELALHSFKKLEGIKNITVVHDGKEALDYLFQENSSTKPTFILLDLKLPRISGLDVLKEVKKHQETKLIPIVIFSSSSLESDVQECYTLGANSYIAKPVEFEEYVQAIQQIGLYWLSYNAPAPIIRGIH